MICTIEKNKIFFFIELLFEHNSIHILSANVK